MEEHNLEKIIKLSVKDNSVIILDDTNSCFKNLFSGCRVSFLLGAGFSANLLGTLNNNEIVFEALRKYQTIDEVKKKKCTILSAYLYWSYFFRCIFPIVDKVSIYSHDFDVYMKLGTILYRIFLERSNPALDRQFNIFTTNYDPIIETMFDHSRCIYNDGFEGRIQPVFSTDNYTKSYYRQAVFSNRKAEIPSLNLIKLHGSITWAWDIIEGNVEYQPYDVAIRDFEKKYTALFNTDTLETIKRHFTANTPAEAEQQIESMLQATTLDSMVADVGNYETFLHMYKYNFLIVNPTKEKFSDTLLNKNYYELLRIFSNELEKENSLLVVNGFSFRDEHILDLVKRSMVNPSLKVLIFCYNEDNIESYESLLDGAKNDNITYVCLDGEKLSLTYFNQILSHIHA